MSASTKNVDPAFQGVGHKIGTEIWRIENFVPVPLPKSDYGKFYSGDSYIVLQTTSGKGGSYLYDIHFWLGKDTTQDEAGTAAIKTVELDAVLGGRAVQYRELQGHESDKFLSYFKPCIIPLEGGVASGFRKPEEDKFEIRLYVCKGKRVVKLKQVPFARSSLNHDDVFILDTEHKIYQFNGANSNIQERAKALEVIQFLKEKYHEGSSEVAIVDGKFIAESDSGEFWLLFGGFAPIAKKLSTEDDVNLETTPPKLYSINDGQLKLEEGALAKAMLENNRCYIVDCGSEIFIWVGRVTQLEERKSASKVAEEFITEQNRPKATRITQVIQGCEPRSFKSLFESWPVGAGTATSGGEEGRGKVAALLKQQGVDVKGAAKASPLIEEVPPLLEGGGKLEVWCVNGSAKTPVPKEEIGKFYSGDSYIVLYTYHSSEKKEDYFLSCWLGKDSIQDDQVMALRLSNTLCNSLKGRPVQGRIIQGKEPPQFIALFQPMVILKGGISSGYKKSIIEKNLNDETYTSDGIALIQVSGTAAHNNKAVQVDTVAASLSSTDCFILQSGTSLFIWHGNSSNLEQQQWAAKVSEFLKPGVTVKHTKEGTESSSFWFALGGKQSFFSSKKVIQDTVRDPHLYVSSLDKGKLEITEVFNFGQDDLLPEDIMILDTHAEVFVWLGQSVDSKEKQLAMEIGQKYVELAVALEGLSRDVPLFKIAEGNEPCFFTTFFNWDGTKSSVPGNSFQKKLSLLFGFVHSCESKEKSSNLNNEGTTQKASAMAALSSAFSPSAGSSHSTESSHHINHDGPTQRASALAALSSAFNPSSGVKDKVPKPARSSQSSQRATAVAALSHVLTAEQKIAASESSNRFSCSQLPETTSKETGKTDDASSEAGNSVESSSAEALFNEIQPEEPTGEGESQLEGNREEVTAENVEAARDNESGERTFSYDRLKSRSSNPVKEIDYKRREAYLSNAEFETVMGMTKAAFYGQPRWKQDMQKRKADLF